MTQSIASIEPVSRFATSRWRRISGLVLGWVAFIALWAFISRFILDEFTLPGPAKVGAAMWEKVVEGRFIDDFAASISKTFMGFGLGVVFGVPVGYAMGRSRYWKAFFHDGVVGAGSIPGITYAVLALVVFGTGFLGPVLAVGLISMPFIALSVAEGVEGVDPNLVRMAKAFRRNDRQISRHIQLPSIMPFVFAGVRLAFAIAWKVEALTEVFGSSNGVGFQIRFAFQAFSITNVLAWTLLFIIFMLMIERGLAWIERRVFRWRTWERTA
ncbi:MAG TPA: ABC transporter permease [Acidimicrobiia bacterium]